MDDGSIRQEAYLPGYSFLSLPQPYDHLVIMSHILILDKKIKRKLFTVDNNN
jgi:hypothetical protein